MTEQIGAILDVVLGPLTVLPPYLAIAIVSALLTILIIGFSRIVTKKKILDELKGKMEEIRENLNKAQQAGDKESINKHLGEMMKLNSQFMKHSMKTLIISFIVILFILPWVQFRYEKTASVVSLPFNLPFIGSSLNWVGWYFLVSLAIGWILNKLFS